VFQALRGAFEARACHRPFEGEAEVFGLLQRFGFGGYGFQILSEKPLHLFLVSADGPGFRVACRELGGRVE